MNNDLADRIVLAPGEYSMLQPFDCTGSTFESGESLAAFGAGSIWYEMVLDTQNYVLFDMSLADPADLLVVIFSDTATPSHATMTLLDYNAQAAAAGGILGTLTHAFLLDANVHYYICLISSSGLAKGTMQVRPFGPAAKPEVTVERVPGKLIAVGPSAQFSFTTATTLLDTYSSVSINDAWSQVLGHGGYVAANLPLGSSRTIERHLNYSSPSLGAADDSWSCFVDQWSGKYDFGVYLTGVLTPTLPTTDAIEGVDFTKFPGQTYTRQYVGSALPTLVPGSGTIEVVDQLRHDADGNEAGNIMPSVSYEGVYGPSALVPLLAYAEPLRPRAANDENARTVNMYVIQVPVPSGSTPVAYQSALPTSGLLQITVTHEASAPGPDTLQATITTPTAADVDVVSLLDAASRIALVLTPGAEYPTGSYVHTASRFGLSTMGLVDPLVVPTVDLLLPASTAWEPLPFPGTGSSSLVAKRVRFS